MTSSFTNEQAERVTVALETIATRLTELSVTAAKSPFEDPTTAALLKTAIINSGLEEDLAANGMSFEANSDDS